MNKEKIITIVLVLVIILAVVSMFMTFDLSDKNNSSLNQENTQSDQEGTIQLTIIKPPTTSGGENE